MLTICVPQEDVTVELAKSVSIEEQRLQQHISALDSDATRDSSCSNTDDKKDIEIDDSDESDMDLSDDEPKGDDDAAGFRYIHNLLIEPLVHELTNLMSNLVYTDAHTTSVMANPKGNPKVTSYISGASEVPFGTNVGLQATILVFKEMFLDDADHPISSSPANTTHNSVTNPQKEVTLSQSKEDN
ncbi:hypothetical protein Tco_0896156 [Tanacetum coccineum]